ncbi:MAG: class I SAM-dependent methyltransferase [Spirochaetales bacterium]|nr:class I SAM-dependent methyltransferase [Spirochaetales bacterium]
MKPIINWQELMKIVLPSPKPPGNGESPWMSRAFADMYNRMSALERTHTTNQVECMGIRPEDTVLDSGCGPGRLSVPLAKRAKSVTSLDFNPYCLEHVRENAAKEGVKNITPVLKDWTTVTPEEIGTFDVVVCSRSAGLSDFERLSSFSRRIVAVVSWGDGPNIPMILGEIFKGTSSKENPSRNRFHDRRFGFNMMFNTVYDLGFAPNVRYVEDGFTADFASRDEAYEHILPLGEVDKDKVDIFKANLEPYLTIKTDGTVTFLRKTESVVMWWDVNHRQ